MEYLLKEEKVSDPKDPWNNGLNIRKRSSDGKRKSVKGVKMGVEGMLRFAL